MRKLLLFLAVPVGSSAQTAQLDAFMREQMAKQSIPGAQVVVMKDGKVLADRSYGVANIELSVPVTAKTVFPVASVTKTFTGTAVMSLVEQGKFSLDDDVRKLLPELPEAWTGVNVRQLLGHTSGLPDVIVNPFTGTWLGDTRADALKKLAELPMQAKPGAAWSYNQTNYMLLGILVEKYSGMSFDDFIMQKIVKPSALASASYGDSKVVVPNRGTWYSIIDFSDGRPKRAKSAVPGWVTYPSFIHTAAGLNMTALDLARFAVAVAAGKIIKPASLDQMWTAVKLNDGSTFRMEKTLGVGLGWLVDDIPGHRAVGGTGGSTVAFRHYRDDKVTVVVMTNLQGIDPDSMVDSIAALYIPALKTAASLPGS
jgi:CubicO group peptidase (beta-lactamase class C family)